MTSYAPGSFGDTPFEDPMTQQPQSTTPPQNAESRPIQGYVGPYVSDTEETTPQPGALPPPIGALDTITRYYQNDLGRDPDKEGLNFWLNSIQSGQNSLDDVRNAINNSQEGQRYDINSLYKNVLGREADEPGFNNWLGALQSGTSLEKIQNAFYGSDEYQATHPIVKPKYPFTSPFEPKPEIFTGEPIKDPVWFDENGDPHMGYNPNPQPKPEVPRFKEWEPPGPEIFDESGNVIGHRTEEERMTPPKWYTDQFINTPQKSFEETDEFQQMYNNPFQWVTSQPQYVQNKFEEYLSVFKDPKKALMYTITGGPSAPEGSVI
jgi:hypothetical protein